MKHDRTILDRLATPVGGKAKSAMKQTICVLLGHQPGPGPETRHPDRIVSRPCIHCGKVTVTRQPVRTRSPK